MVDQTESEPVTIIIIIIIITIELTTKTSPRLMSNTLSVSLVIRPALSSPVVHLFTHVCVCVCV
jgi:hypothetical protein